MALICEECGKIYHIDKEKFKNQIKGESAKTKCRICGHIIQISREELEKEDNINENNSFDTDSFEAEEPLVEETFVEDEEEVIDSETKETKEKKPNKNYLEETEGRKVGLGLRAKMFMLFLIIPILLMSASGLYSQYQLKRLSQSITNKGTQVVKEFAEKRIAEKARDVALQCQIYLLSHPELRKSDFNYVNAFKKIAVQKIGKTGYTSLAQRSLPTEPLKSFRIWAHPNPAIVGVPLFKKLESVLGTEFKVLLDTLNPLVRGEEVGGYYKWKESNGELKEKFLVAVHVKHTKYVIIATAPIEEFTEPIVELEKEASKLTVETRNINILILVITLIIISISISVYGYRISKNIRYLTDTADRISVGELDVKIEISSKDEIGSLADAISRMQDSLRLSIERLRRRR